MKKLKLFFACLLMAVLSIGQVWAGDVTWSWNAVANLGSANSVTTSPAGDKILEGTVSGVTTNKTWTLAMTSKTTKYYLMNGQFGSNTNACTAVSLSTAAFTDPVKYVRVNASAAGTATITITVGSTTYVDAESLTSSSATYANSTAQSATGTITISYSQPSTSKNMKIYSIEVVTDAGGDPDPVLQSIAVSSDPSTTTYEDGDIFDVTGLVVTGTYDVGDPSAITEGITWKARTSALSNDEVALANYHLTQGQTSLQVQATVSEIPSDWYSVSGITVNEHVVTPGTYDITFCNAFFGTTGLNGPLSGANLKDYSGSQNDLTAAYQKGTGSNMYLKDSEIRLYNGNKLVVTAPAGYAITAITGLKSTMSANVGEIEGTAWSGKTNSVTLSHGSSSGNSALTTISVTYVADVKYGVSFSTPTGGTLVIKDGDDPITSGDKFDEDKELTVTIAPDETHTDGEIAVTKTVGGDDVTASVLSGTTLTVPAYDITVAATFTPTYEINIVANGGTVALEDDNGDPITGRVVEGTEVMATATADGSHVFSALELSDNVTVSDIDENVAMFTMPAGNVTITATFADKPCTKLGTPANVAASGTSYPYNAVALDWDDVANADHYEVVIKKAGVTVESDIVDESEYACSTTLLANTTYTYEIKATSENTTDFCESNVASDNFATSDYPSVTVTYSENGNTDHQESKKIQTAFALPTTAAECSKTFVGWTTKSDFADGDESLPSYYVKGAEFTIENNAAITLYAVYATETPGAAGYSLSNAAPADGDHVIIARLVSGTYYGLTSAATPATSALTVSAGAVSEPADEVSWDVDDAEEGVYLRPTGVDGSSLHMNSSALKVATGDTNGDIKFSANGNGSFKGTRADGARWIVTSGTNGLSCSSTEANAAELYFFKYGAGASSFSEYAITCAAAIPQLDEPEFTVTAGTYYEAKTIGITATNEADIYYTLDGSAPTKTTGTKYTDAISLSERAITTIKAIAVKEGFENSNVAEAEYNINLPYDFADFAALTKENNKEYAVRGIISQKGTLTASNQLPYWISATGSTEGQIKCHNGLGSNKATFTSADDVNLGDNVTVVGTWSTQYSNINANNWMLEYTARVHDSYEIVGSLTATSFNDGDPFSDAILANLSVNDVFTNNYREAVAGATFNCGDKTAWHDGETTLTVYAKLGDDDLTSKDFAITVSSASLVSIALKADDAGYQTKKVYYLGEDFVAPTIVATLDDESTIEAVAAYVSGFDNTNAGEQEVTVSYTRGTITESTSYNITMKKIFDNEDAPHTVAVAKQLIQESEYQSTTSSTDYMWVRGIVSRQTSYNSSYYISDDGSTNNELYVYSGKYFNNESFTAETKLPVGDVVIVKATILNYNGSTAELTGSQVTYQLREGELSIDDVASFEVGADDLAEADLTIARNGSDGAITFESGNTSALTIVENKLHSVDVGDVVVTATMAATDKTGEINFTGATTTFNVHVIAEQVKYAITFDGNGNTDGSAPEAIADKAAGAEVTLPANSYIKTGHTFSGWKVINNTTSEEVEVVAGAFTMPASAVTIQAQWAAVSPWAYVYDNNVAVVHGGTSGEDNATISISDTEYKLVKAGSGSKTGTIKVTVPAGATDLHFHAFTWNSTTAKIQIAGVTNPSISEFDLAAEAGASGSGTAFTLQGNPVDQYFHVSFDAVAAETEIVFSKAAGSADNRFFFYGVNQEGGDFGSYQRSGLTAGNYATICLPNGGTISNNAKLYDLEYFDGDNTLYLLEVNGNAMEAGHPYIFLPSETSIEVTYTNNFNASAGSFNGLVGSYLEKTILANAGNYILWKNAYYFVDSQARVGANRAYIHMADVPTEPSTPQLGAAPRRRVAMTVNGKDAAQGFENLQSVDAPVKIMIDGTMYILRGEKVYDATGRLVK